MGKILNWINKTMNKFWHISNPMQQQQHFRRRQRRQRRQQQSTSSRQASPYSRVRRRQQAHRDQTETFLSIHTDQQQEPSLLHFTPDQPYQHYTVHDVKLWCKDFLYIPLNSMTLQYNGGFLNDDHATLPSLGIPSTAHIVVFGDQVTEDQMHQTTSGDLEEVGACNIIDKVVHETESLAIYVAQLEQQQQQQPPKMDELRHVSEILTRALITLDGVECPSLFDKARHDRRQAIRFCKELLDRVDAMKSRVGPQ